MQIRRQLVNNSTSMTLGLLFTALCSASNTLQAQNYAAEQLQAFHSLEEIARTAEDYAFGLLDSGSYSNVRVTAQQMDARLKLKACDSPLEASSNNGWLKAGRASIGIRCTGSTPWSLYVPVMINATTSVVRIKGPMTRGMLISTDDLESIEVDVGRLPPNYLTDIADVAGKELNRTVNNDTWVTANMLREPKLIEKGQEVVILARNQNLEVRMTGVALEHGQEGDRISVKNSGSGRTIEGTVTGAGIIVVSL